MTTWSEIVAIGDQLCQVNVCAEGDEDCAECLQISYHRYLRPAEKTKGCRAVSCLYDCTRCFNGFSTSSAVSVTVR